LTSCKPVSFSRRTLHHGVSKGTVHEIKTYDVRTVMAMYHTALLRMRYVSDQSCRENLHTRFLCSVTPPPENRAAYEIMWKNIVQPDRPQMTIQHMHFACWIPKATDTHSEYVIFIAFPPQQWLHEHASMLPYTHTVCIVTCYLLYAVSARWSGFPSSRIFRMIERLLNR